MRVDLALFAAPVAPDISCPRGMHPVWRDDGTPDCAPDEQSIVPVAPKTEGGFPWGLVLAGSGAVALVLYYLLLRGEHYGDFAGRLRGQLA